MKVALVMALARYFHGAHLDDMRRPWCWCRPLLLILVPCGAGPRPARPRHRRHAAASAARPCCSWPACGCGSSWRWAPLGAAALPVLWANLHDYQRQRVFTFLDPEADPLGAGYHIIQSKIALGSGGLWGQGFLHGTQAQLELPAREADRLRLHHAGRGAGLRRRASPCWPVPRRHPAGPRRGAARAQPVSAGCWRSAWCSTCSSTSRSTSRWSPA